mgnify:FL=1|tara:strand:+ start:641 stop:1168 length:528 start_codon:yes stop_codon:yes gene_type:complete
MACDLSLGRIEPCKDSVGGLNAIYFVNFGDLGAITYDVTDTDVIDAIAGTPSAYKYDIKGSSTFTQNIQSDRATGTTAFEQVLEVTLKKLSAADHKELKLLAYGRPHVIVEDYNGNYFLAGLQHGCDVTGGTIVTGGAMNELSGYTLTLTGMEKVPANFLGDTPTAVGFTVVSGS